MFVLAQISSGNTSRAGPSVGRSIFYSSRFAFPMKNVG